jgi:hypothetical protein
LTRSGDSGKSGVPGEAGNLKGGSITDADVGPALRGLRDGERVSAIIAVYWDEASAVWWLHGHCLQKALWNQQS